MLATQQLFLGCDESLPEAIVTSISYGSFDALTNRRGDDYSADAPDARERQSGAPAFLRFLQSELLPQVEGRVRGDPARRVLVGQSLGGYVTLWSAYADSDLSWGRIASNPVMAPGKQMLFDQLRSP